MLNTWPKNGPESEKNPKKRQKWGDRGQRWCYSEKSKRTHPTFYLFKVKQIHRGTK